MGKSAIVGIILYCLFGNCERGNHKKIINFSKDEFSCSIIIRIGGIKYKITRSSERNGLLFNTKVKLLIFNEATGIWKVATDKLNVAKTMIASLVGPYDDFITTVICLQDQGYSKNRSIVKMSSGGKTAFLMNILGVDCVVGCMKNAKKKFKSAKQKRDSLLGDMRKQLGDKTQDRLTNEIKT